MAVSTESVAEPVVTVSTESVVPEIVDTPVEVSTSSVVVPEVVAVSTETVIPEVVPSVEVPISTAAPAFQPTFVPSNASIFVGTSPSSGNPSAVPMAKSTETVVIEKVTFDESGNRLLVLIQTSKPVECFVFERRDPPSLFVQFLSSRVYASGAPIQVVGTDPLSEIRYGYTSFQDAATARDNDEEGAPIDYLELRLNRPVFYHVQQEGWVIVVGLDRTTTRVDVPDLDFRFEAAKYEGAANLKANPRVDDFIQVALANSRLLTVAREEAELAKYRVWEAQRSLYPAITGRVNATRGKEVNPFPSEEFEGFEATSFRRDEYGVQVTQPIYQSGRLYGALRQAKLNRQMALENVRKQAQDLTFETKKAYFTVLKNQSILRIRRELVAQGQVIKDLVRQKQKLNITSRAEVLNVTAQADQASYQLTGDEQDLALSRLVLISLLNQSGPVPEPIPSELGFGRLSFNVESIISWAQEHRPDVRIARLNSELARYNWKAAKADNSIKLDASGFYGRAGAAFAEDDLVMNEAWNMGLRVSRSFWGNSLKGSYSKERTAPDLGQSFITDSQQKSVELGLLDTMPGVSNARQAQLQYERSKAELVEASRKAEYEVRETYYNLEKAARQVEAVREDVAFRHKDLEITREKVKLGLSESSQLMAAEVAAAQTDITLYDALSAYNLALAAMDRAAGAEVVRN